MTDLNSKLETIKSNENFLEKIARYIPGYDGYVNRDNARELDTMLRNTLADKLDQNQTRLKNIVLNLSRSGKLFETEGINRLDKKLQQCVAKFRSAARGYSGAFDVVKVKEDKLNKLYEFDSSLLSVVDSITHGFSELESASAGGGDIGGKSSAVSASLDELLRLFDDRENILKEI
jgi:hypothetical protein